MKKSMIPGLALAAIIFACPLLQSCADTSRETTYTTTTGPAYYPADTRSQTTYTTTTSPGYYPPDSSSQTTYTTTTSPAYYPQETTTRTTTTTNGEPESVVGATTDTAGAVVALPFRIVGDVLGTVF